MFDVLKGAGVTCVLSMLPRDEADLLGMAEEADMCAARGLVFLNHPICDFGLPEIEVFAPLIQDLRTRLRKGHGIAVHCRAGIGRSGMAVSSLLIALGVDASDAKVTVSKARGVSIPDTVEQATFIDNFEQSVKSDNSISI
ncbi:MAG: hypothetical protein AB8B60_00980 [Sulfitobacter sp.]